MNALVVQSLKKNINKIGGPNLKLYTTNSLLESIPTEF